MNRLIGGYCRLLKALIAACLAVMVVLVFGNVVLRYGFNSGITVSEEVSRWLFVWMTFLGATVALFEHGHLGTDMLVSRLPRAGRKLCAIASQLLMLWATWLVGDGALQQARINLDVTAPVTGMPVAVFYASGVVFAVSTGLILLVQLARLVTGRVADDELMLVQESEDLAVVHDLHLDEPAPAVRSR